MRGFSSSVPYLRSLCKEADIIAISEHWLHENMLKQFEDVTDNFSYCARSSKFALAENYGSKRGQGGVAILWRNSVGGVSQMSNIIHDRMCGIRLQTAGNLIINIVSIYLPSQGSPESLSACLDDLSDLIESRENGSMTIICGDANCDMGHLGGKKSEKTPTNRGRKFYDFISTHNLVSVNCQSWSEGPLETFIGPTGSTTIDHILTPYEMLENITKCRVLHEDPLNCSDHNAIIISLAVGELLPTTVNVIPPRVTRWNKISSEDINAVYTKRVNEKMEDILTFVGQIDNPLQIDEAFEMVVDVLMCASKALPASKFRPNLKPFWSPELSNFKTEKIAKYRIWVAEGRPRSQNSKSWSEHKCAKKSFAKAIKRVSKEYENEKMIEAIESNSTDRSAFWRHLKKCRKSPGSKILAIKNKRDKVVYEVKEILEVWHDHFSLLSTPVDDKSYDSEHFNLVNKKVYDLNAQDDNSIFLEAPISTREVQKAVNRLKGQMHHQKDLGSK